MLEGLSTVGSPYFLSFDKHAFLHTFGQKTEGMSSIVQQPDTLSLSQNLKKFVIHSDAQVSFVLRHKEEEILSQLYDPSSDGRIEVDLRDIVHARLSYMLKEETLPYEQTALVGDFTAVIDETEVTFRVVRGGVDRLADTATNFLMQNWLTWQPTVKPVTYYSPEYLTYYAPVACSVKLKATFADQTDTTLTYHALEAGKAYTLPMQYSVIVGKLGDKKPAYYDAWVENEEGERLTYIQRYYADNMRSIHEDWVLFENSLGGLDCFRAYGTTELEAEHTHNIAEIDEVSEEYRVDTERKYQKNTGHLGKDEARWLLDFFPAAKKYIYTGNYLRAIVVVESSVTGNLRELPSNYTFTYRYADARPLLNLPRTDVPVEMLHIEIPEVGNFTLPPRLAEVERLPLSEGDLFPVQNPYSEKWGTTTTGALATVIGQLLGESAGSGGGVGHTHQNIDLLKALSYVLEYLLVNGKKIKAGYADIAGDIEGDKFIRKDREDGTNYLLKIGEFIDSLTAGKGIGLFPDGRAQVSSLEVRDSLNIGKSGAQITKEGAGELLSLVLRGILQSDNFVKGALGTGYALIKQDETGKSYLEVDKLFVRIKAFFTELEIKKLSYAGGNFIFSPAGITLSKVEEGDNAYRCYFTNDDGSSATENLFRVDDLVLSQTFNIKEGIHENVGNRRYWRAVVAVGDNWFDLSKTDCEADSDVPQEGDSVVVLGNKTDASRQNAIVISVYGEGSPSFTEHKGIKTYSLEGTELTRISPTSGNKFTGDFVISSSGENVKDELDKINGNLTDVNGKVDKAVSDLAENIDFVNQLSSDLESVKNQVDGAIESYFEKTDPTTSNYPASSWTTEELKQAHANDTYTNISTGKSWKWVKNGSTWKWSVITDTATEKALALAGKAQDTADGKRRVFVSTPTNASTYDVGDLWVNATYGGYSNDLLRCKVAKAANAIWSIDHWELAAKYTDDTKAKEALEAANNAQESADTAQNAANQANIAAGNAQNTANQAKEDAENANNELNLINNDGYISPSEKSALSQQQKDIQTEYNDIISQANKYGVSTTSYTSAYNYANEALNKYTSSTPTHIRIESDYENISSYYTARQNILNSISTAAKKVATDAQESADEAKNEAELAKQAAATAQATADKAKDDASAAQTAADKANAAIADLAENIDGAFSDGIISEAEAIAIGKYTNQINESFTSINATYTEVYSNIYLEGSAKTNLKNKYDSLVINKTSLLNAISTAISDGKATTEESKSVDNAFAAYNSSVSQYQTALEQANESIQSKIKSYADAAQEAADNAQSSADKAIADAANAQVAADNALSEANSAKDRLDEWASDGTISPTEKQALKDEIARIDADKTQISNGYNKYGLGLPTAFDNAYTSYRTVLVSLTASSPESIAIPSDFKTKQENYYSERTIALTKISDAAKDYAEDLVGNIQVGGRNYNVLSSLILGATSGLTGTFTSGDTYATSSYFIDFNGGGKITISSDFDDYIIHVCFFDLNRIFLDSTYKMNGNSYQETFPKTFDIPSNTRYIKHTLRKKDLSAISLSELKESCKIKIELGNIPTDWTPAPEDTSSAIQEALETAQDAQTAANNADEKASQAASRLDEWASDSVISPTEKLSLKQEQKMITAEKDTIVADAAKYGVSSTAYVNAFNAYNAELTYHTTATPENITIRSSFATNQVAYYTAYKNINSAIADAAKKFANDIAKDLDSYKKTVTAKFEQTNNSITAAVTTSKEYTNEAVSNIQVGGRNLLLNSKTSFSAIGGSKNLNLSITWYSLRWKQVTISFDYEYINVSTGSNFNQCRIGAEKGLLLDDGTTDYRSASAWLNLPSSSTGLNGKGRFSKTFKIKENIAENQSNILSFYIQVLSGTVTISNFKMELGNKATDWTPAPEDIKSSIDSVSNTLTTYKQETDSRLVVLEDKIALTVTSEELQQTRTEILNSAATTAQSKADAAKQAAISTAAQDATNKVNAIQIGGRNLLKGTKDLSFGSFNGDKIQNGYEGFTVIHRQYTAGNPYIDIVRYSSLITPKPNTTYTLSFYCKGTGKFGSYFYPSCVSNGENIDGNTTGIEDGSISTNLTTDWRRVWIRWKTKSSISETKNVLPIRLQSVTSEIWACGFKFEESTKATDWSPAPEDVTSDIEKAKQEAIADAAGKYVTTTTYTQKINQITADLNGVSLKATKTETKVTEIDGEITSLENRVSEAEIAVQPDNIAAIVTSTVKVGGVNLLLNSYYLRSLTNTSQKDTYAYYDDLSVYLEKGKTYVLSSKTNGKWTSRHGVFGNNNVTIWITKGISGTYNRIISSVSMKPDGSYGSVFTHTGETGEYVLRFNIYDAGTFWFKETKIENGTISTDYSKAPQDQYTDNSYLSRGKMIYRDPTFAEGKNSAFMYNNANNGNVILERVNNVTGNPNTSGYCLKITAKGAANPNWGGFAFSTRTKANRILLTKIVAKIPVGRTIAFVTNATGDNSRREWLTSNKGTGEWSEYIFRLICGSTGTFSTTNFFCLKDGTTPTEASPLVWYVAFATVYDVTGVDDTPTKDEIKTGITIAQNVINVFGKAINLTGAVTFSSLANDAQSKINTAVSDSSTALSAANTANSNVTASKDTIAKELGYSSFADMQAKPTIIDGGYIRTSYLESEAIRATIITASYLSTLSITTGNITVTDGAKIGNLIISGNSLVAEDISKSILVVGSSLAGRRVVIGGIDAAVGINVYATVQNTPGLGIEAAGSTNCALKIAATNAQYAMSAFGGCNWTMNPAHTWIMPGLLWCARMSNGGTIYDQFGDACGTVTTRRTGVGKYLIQHNLGHGEYVPVVIADQGSTGNLFANVEDVQYDHFYVRIIHKDQSYKDASFYVAILGRTKNP